jgi:tetratricopeptide (TPR) repeat protein
MTAAPKRLSELGIRISQEPAAADRCRLAALALQKQGRIDQAIRLYLRGLALNPSDAAAYRCLGTAYKTQRRFDLAIACFRRAVELCPAFPEAWNNLGNTLTEQKDDAGAADCFEQAFKVQPQFAGAHFNFAQAVGRMGRFDDAITASRKATELSPRSAEFYNGLGMALYDARRVDEAIAAYDQAVAIRPTFAPAHYNRSHALLASGDYERGWPEYEWRWKLDTVKPPAFSQPRWDGGVQPHATILLEAEQGLGDTIQFARYVSLVKERVGSVVLRCQKPLVQLLAALPGVDRLISQEEDPGYFDVWSPLMSLPLYFTPTVQSIPNRAPYLFANDAAVRFWQARLAPVRQLRVGIHWQGNPAFPKDRFRSIPLRYFEPLARAADVSLISLQKGTGREQLSNGTTFPVLDLNLTLDEIHGPFVDTAAILKCLDLVVTSDTSLAHLAGALGVETWLAVPSLPEWRWLLGRDDSPWYPTMRLFRQNRPGQWADVFLRMAAQLTELIAHHKAALRESPQTLPIPPR